MSNEQFPPDDHSEGPIDPELLDLLSSAEVWEPLDPQDELAILEAIGQERDSRDTAASRTQSAEPSISEQPVSTNGQDRSRFAAQRVIPFLAGAAAALLAVVASFAVLNNGDSSEREGIEVALSATDLSPQAAGSIEIIETPDGTAIVLTVSDLPPAPEGTYYQAWLVGENGGVGAGTFHLRGGGDEEIELWAGVTPGDYPTFTITIQDEAEQTSSGEVLLRAELE